MKLNIGSGFRKMDGYINVDNFEECKPDVLMNLEETPWTFERNSVSEITAIHVLEHLGEQRDVFFNIIKEIYRVLKNDGIIKISVPFYMHPTFYTDPTHVRSFTSGTFKMLSKKVNQDWMDRNVNATMLAFMLDVDFDLINVSYKYDPVWDNKLKNNEISQEEIIQAAQEKWGVVQELNVILRACKEA